MMAGTFSSRRVSHWGIRLPSDMPFRGDVAARVRAVGSGRPSPHPSPSGGEGIQRNKVGPLDVICVTVGSIPGRKGQSGPKTPSKCENLQLARVLRVFATV